MARLSEVFDFGGEDELTQKELLRYLQDMYTRLAIEINRKPDIYQRNTDGQTTDVTLSNGSININSTTNKVEMITNHATPATVVWTQLS